MKNELLAKLEKAYEHLKQNVHDPIIIVHLRSDGGEANVYLSAKDPERDMYYGIFETEFTDKRQMAGIPGNNLKGLGLKIIPITPFKAKPYIETGVKVSA